MDELVWKKNVSLSSQNVGLAFRRKNGTDLLAGFENVPFISFHFSSEDKWPVFWQVG